MVRLYCKVKHCKYVLLIFLAIPIVLLGQTDSSAKRYLKTRKIYIQDLTGKLNTSAVFRLSENGFELRSNDVIRVKPNQLGNVGIRLSHRWLTIGFSVKIKNLQTEEKGITNLINLTASTCGKKLGFDLYYLSFKGHYISNQQIDLTPQIIDQKTYPILPNLNTLYAGFNAYYTFNHGKFSYRANFIRNEIQKKSAGSWLLGVSYSHFQIKSDSGFIPIRSLSNIPTTSKIINGKFNSLGLLPGYAYTWVFAPNYFCSFSTSFGLMSQSQKYQTFDEKDLQNSDRSLLYPRGMVKLSIGYNTLKWYWGAAGVLDNNIINLPGNDLVLYYMGDIHVYIGYRFNIPKILRKTSNFIEENSPANLIENLTD